MRENIASTARIEIRLTQKEKEAIKEYSAKHNMTMSDFIRYACQKIFQETNN